MGKVEKQKMNILGSVNKLVREERGGGTKLPWLLLASHVIVIT
jgi:hypothetical protein